MVSGVLDQRLAGVITHMVQQLSEERAQSKSRGGDGGDGGWRDDASDGGSSSTGRISSHMPGMCVYEGGCVWRESEWWGMFA